MKEKTLKTNIFNSIMTRLIMLYMALVFIVMIISGTFIYMSIRDQEARNVEEELKSNIKHMSELFEKYDDVLQIYEKMTNPKSTDAPVPLGGRSDIELLVLNADGLALAPKEVEGRRYYNDSVIISAASGTAKFEAWEKGLGKVSGSVIKVWMKHATPVYDEEGNVKYIVYIARNADDLLEKLDAIIRTIIVAVAIAMVLAAILGVLFSTTITGPISSLTKIAGEMAGGNLEQEISVKSNDEIGQLTLSFGNMAKSLAMTMSDISIEKSRIEIILNNMTDGVLAYDSLNNLVHANNASMEMLDLKDISNLQFDKVMAMLGLPLKASGDFQSYVMKDNIIAIKNKYISINYSPYSSQTGTIEGIVIVLQDVTKHTKLDNMRKEFVANVSHEIRTPLTTIKTYTETLLEGALDDRQTAENFLQTINMETDRMTVLTTDLLELSHFDNKQLKMEMEEANLISIINNSLRQNTVLAQKKGQKLSFCVDNGDAFICCDPARINQVINNIVSNAIKYSGENTEIKISVEEEADIYKVSISDEGMGIPEEDLDRIFERFYRVDKARSRLMGGTGLGLSIVKEIMEAHGGSVKALRNPDKGTTMILKFNKSFRE